MRAEFTIEFGGFNTSLDFTLLSLNWKLFFGFFKKIKNDGYGSPVVNMEMKIKLLHLSR